MKKNIIYILTIICLMFLPDIALAQTGGTTDPTVNRLNATIDLGTVSAINSKKTVMVSNKSGIKTTIDINAYMNGSLEVTYDLRSAGTGITLSNVINMFIDNNTLVNPALLSIWEGTSSNMRLFSVRYTVTTRGNYTIKANLQGMSTAAGTYPVYVTITNNNIGKDPRQVNLSPDQTINPQPLPGDNSTYPVSMGTISDNLTKSASYSLVKYDNIYTNLAGGDIYFKFTTTRKMDLSLTSTLSRARNASVSLLNSSAIQIDHSSQNNTSGFVYSKTGLETGTYYIVFDQSHMGGTATLKFDFSGDNYPENPTEPSQPVESVGKVITKEVSYKYNVRSWTTEIKNDGYTQNLNYTHSGNIKDMTWKTGSPVKTRKYEYTYDQLSRLLRAKYTGLTNENFSTSYSYDKHGNIMTLGRFGKKDAGTGTSSFVRVDSLQMTYSGNQLTRVTDKGVSVAVAESEDFKDYINGSGQYTYNTNGALTKDTHKGILGISYNSLNLPREIAIKNSSVSGKNYYTYLASGVKLKTVHMGSTNLNYVPVLGSTSGDANFNEVTTTEYIGNKVYEDNVLKKILVEGGYYDVEKEKYFFYVQDHLGNNRLVADENGTVTQATHYYPFGQGFANSEGQDEQPYKYNGKEQDRRHGLNMYDYSARHMEPAIGRFTTVDPHAERYYSMSPYAYCGNNPINFIDPNGMDSLYFQSTFVAPAPGSPMTRIHLLAQADKEPYAYVGTYSEGEGGDDVVMVDLAVVDVSPSYTYETGGVIRSYEGTIIGERPLKLSNPEFEAITLGRGLANSAVKKAIEKAVTNPVPGKVARVIPANIESKTLGAPGADDVFVTAAKDIKGLDAAGIAKRLTIPESNSGFKVIEFNTPLNGLSSPIKRTNPGFVGRGQTLGGAREFTIPNQVIPNNAKIKIVK